MYKQQHKRTDASFQTQLMFQIYALLAAVSTNGREKGPQERDKDKRPTESGGEDRESGYPKINRLLLNTHRYVQKNGKSDAAHPEKHVFIRPQAHKLYHIPIRTHRRK